MARAAVYGASGAMGRCVVNTLARDPRIGTVIAVVRTEHPAAFWFLEGDPAWAKVTYIILCLHVHTCTLPNARPSFRIGGSARTARRFPDANDQV